MLIEFHLLKNYPPVNLNRDETGAPKSCFFGGKLRGRISSQCLKRSWRLSDAFKALDSSGLRTRRMPEKVADALRKMGVDEETAKVAQLKLTGIANKDGKENDAGITSQIVMYTPAEIEAITQCMYNSILEDKTLEQFKKRSPKNISGLIESVKLKPMTADIALFGRMVTSDYLADVDAAMQVAHAISTHAVNRESDYFTAVDDLMEDQDDLGASMIGDVDYNSCCYYHYASLDMDQLHGNLENLEERDALAKSLLPALLKAMAFTNPSGKQNTFAGHSLPDLIMVECKDAAIPLSYANAYEEPVSTISNNPQIVRNSIRRLFEAVDQMDKAYQLPLKQRLFFVPRYAELAPKNGLRCETFQEMIDRMISWLS